MSMCLMSWTGFGERVQHIYIAIGMDCVKWKKTYAEYCVQCTSAMARTRASLLMQMTTSKDGSHQDQISEAQ